MILSELRTFHTHHLSSELLFDHTDETVFDFLVRAFTHFAFLFFSVTFAATLSYQNYTKKLRYVQAALTTLYALMFYHKVAQVIVIFGYCIILSL